MTTSLPTYADGRTYAYLGRQDRFTDHVPCDVDAPPTCGAVALGAVGDCTRAPHGNTTHQNGATGDTFVIGDPVESTIPVDVDGDAFGAAFDAAREASAQVAASTSTFEPDDDTFYFLTLDGRSGYAVRPTGELVYVFSTVRGRGDILVSTAIGNGARMLDCFDGYLTGLYERHGFSVTRREPNWTPGGPDVVYMHHHTNDYTF